jgi:hypothetical protein
MAAGIAPTQSHGWKVEAESVWVNRSPRRRQLDGVSGRVRLARSDPDRVLGTAPVVVVGATTCGVRCLSFIKPLAAGCIGETREVPVESLFP